MLVSIGDLLKISLRRQDLLLIFFRRMSHSFFMKIAKKPSRFLRRLKVSAFRNTLYVALLFDDKPRQNPRMVHQQKGTSSGSPGSVRARAPLSEVHEDQAPTNFARLGVNAAAVNIGGVVTTRGGGAPGDPVLRGLP